VLIRGHQLDGHHRVDFSLDGPITGKLQLHASSRPLSWPSSTVLHSLGCYGWQIDAPKFSQVLIFRAVATAREAGQYSPTLAHGIARVRFQGHLWSASPGPMSRQQASEWFDAGTMTSRGPTQALYQSVAGYDYRLTFHRIR
jgi:hypothetical protein